MLRTKYPHIFFKAYQSLHATNADIDSKIFYKEAVQLAQKLIFMQRNEKKLLLSCANTLLMGHIKP